MQTFDPPEKWQYAYPGVFEGNLSGCSWAAGQPCRSPLVGDDCFELRCGNIAVDCPPQGQPACPGFTKTSCGKMPPPHDDKPYWMHKCNPLAMPSADKVTVLSCRPDADEGMFQCYFLQGPPPTPPPPLCARPPHNTAVDPPCPQAGHCIMRRVTLLPCMTTCAVCLWV